MNTMKNIVNWMLMGTVMLSLSMSVMSCKDDDDNDSKSQTVVTEDGKLAPANGLTNQEELLMQQQSAIISILTTLTGVEEVDPRFDQQQYEPTYGEVLDQGQPFVRAVRCDSIDEAVARFRNLVTADTLLVETLDGYTITLKDMPLMPDGTKLTLGTLTFHRGDEVRMPGWVDVDIPCIPHLTRIEYLVSSAFPQNASDNSPYMVGDLIWVDKKNLCSGYYLCVSQATNARAILVHLCEGEKKGDETINLDGDGDGCWVPYNSKHGHETSEEDVFAYLRFLLTEKDKVRNLKEYLDGNTFKQKPQHPDKKGHVFPGGFATTSRNVIYKESDDRSGRIFYKARYGSYAWVPAYHYRIATYMWVSKNMQSMKYAESSDYKYVYDSDWNSFEKKYHNFTMNVIHTWEKLDYATVEYSPANDNLEFMNDCKYVTQQNVGWIFGSDHRMYRTAGECKNAGATPLGIIAYVNDGSEWGNQVTEAESGFGHALVLSHSMASSYNMRWNNGDDVMAPIDEWGNFYQYVNKQTGAAAALSDYGGMAKTDELAMRESPAAVAALNMKPTPPVVASNWFLPSAAQWIAILCSPGVGGQPMPNSSAVFPTYIEQGTSKAFDNINSILDGNSWTYYTMKAGHKYWSSSAFSEKVGVYVTASDGYGTRLSYWTNTYGYVRPVFAF